MGATLLTLGVLLILVGLIGQVKAKEIEVGTKNPVVRIIVGFIGVGFVSIALCILLPLEMGSPADTRTATSTSTASTTTVPPASTPIAASAPVTPSTAAQPTDVPPTSPRPTPSTAPREDERRATARAPGPLPRTQTGPISLSANNDPRIVRPGGTTALSVLATARDGTPVPDAQVTISAGGGVFEATGATKVVGRTDGQGVFRTKWRTYEASAYTGDMSYVLEVEVTKGGMIAGRAQLQVFIRK